MTWCVLGIREGPQAETERMRRCCVVMRLGWGRLGSEGNQKTRGAEEKREREVREKGPGRRCTSSGGLWREILQQSQTIRSSL